MVVIIRCGVTDDSVFQPEATQSIQLCDLDCTGKYRCTLVSISLIVELLPSSFRRALIVIGFKQQALASLSFRALKEREVMKYVVCFIVIVNCVCLILVELLRHDRIGFSIEQSEAWILM